MKNTKEQDEEPKFRYRVGYSKPWRVVGTIIAVILMIFIAKWGVDCIRKEGFENVGWAFLIVVVGFVLFVADMHAHIVVYKGRVVVNSIFWKNEYPLSTFGEPKMDADPIYKGTGYKWVPTCVYYDSNGKKLFKVYKEWENSEKFYKEIKQHYSQVWNSQKAKNAKKK